MKRQLFILVSLLLMALLFGEKGRVLAESAGYSLLRGITTTNSVVAVQSGEYQLKATIGQPIAESTTAGTFSLETGYWYRASEAVMIPSPGHKRQYLPMVNR